MQQGKKDPIPKSSGGTNTGGLGTGRDHPHDKRGGEHGEKRPTNADHDQQIAENRRHILDEDRDGNALQTKEHASQGGRNGRSADDVLGQAEGRRSKDLDRERKSGDIVSGKEHSHFPESQAGYDDRTESERPPRDADDLKNLDKGSNDDLSDLDGDDIKPMK